MKTKMTNTKKTARTTLPPGIGKVLKRLHHPLDVILLCVRWYTALLQTEVTYPLKIQLRNRPPKRVIPNQWCIRKAAAYLSVHRRACGQQPDFGRLRRSARSVCALFLATVRKPQIA